MLISRKVTEVSEISHVNLRAGWKELTKPINRSNSSLVQDVVGHQKLNLLSCKPVRIEVILQLKSKSFVLIFSLKQLIKVALILQK